MMAAALGTGSPAVGAALMFAFILGTSPVFFIVAYLTTQVGARLEKFFMRFVAVVVLILGLVSINNGLNLIGSPLSSSNLASDLSPTAENTPPPVTSEQEGILELSVKNNGYFPSTLQAKANQAYSLALVTQNTRSCARDFVIPALKFYELLPETGRVAVDIPPQQPGTVLRFTCSMGMYTGKIIFQ
jgi:plastocyanin domain-containing protein